MWGGGAEGHPPPGFLPGRGRAPGRPARGDPPRGPLDGVVVGPPAPSTPPHAADLAPSAPRPRGAHALAWDGADARGGRAPAGVYFVRVIAGDATRTQRVVLAR